MPSRPAAGASGPAPSRRAGAGPAPTRRPDVGPCCASHASLMCSSLDLPAAVGLAAGRAVGFLAFPADDDVVLELAAVAASRLIGPCRRHRTGMPGVRIGPGDGLARGRRLERPLLRLILLRGGRSTGWCQRDGDAREEAATGY